MNTFGIDVAKWNGVIDWDKVKESEQFAILKVTKKNNNVEDAFETNYKNASKAGMRLGGYRYVYAKNKDQAVAEAEAIVDICRNKLLPYGIWLDMEDSSIRNLGNTTLKGIIDTEAYILRKAGLPVGIYCNKDWYDNVLHGKALSFKYPFWIARYPSNDIGIFNGSSKLNPILYAECWQYSSKGKVDGIKGDVDLDVTFTNIPNMFVASPTLRRGYRGNQVIYLQTNLNRVIQANLEPDGSFGPKTKEALTQFQSITGLLTDGVYGPKTSEVMRNIFG